MKVTYSSPPLVAGSLFAGDAWLTAAKLWCLERGLQLEGWSMARTFTASDNQRHQVVWNAATEQWDVLQAE
jgi:hypothetical protein